MGFDFKSAAIILAFVALGCSSPGLAQTAAPAPVNDAQSPAAPQGGKQTPDPSLSDHSQSDHPALGSVSGTIIDQSGALVAGAHIVFTGSDSAVSQETLSRDDGQFFFTNITPGQFQLTITSKGFAAQTFSGILDPGESAVVPAIALNVASNVTEVEVGVPTAEIAEEQLKVEEKQRILGAIPNFYVTYIPNAAPLTRKQKFELAWKSIIDPVTFLVVGGTAGVEQAQNHFVGYGQGAEGYAKRFGAGYADTVSGTYIGGAILPWLLKQDPRYFYKGTGSPMSRASYAIAMSFICKGDNRRWQPNYSGILGSLAAGGISNIYYPAQDRNGAALTFENAGLGIASTAALNLLQEFVIRKFSTKVPNRDSSKP